MEYLFKGKGISITTPMQNAARATLSVFEKFLNEDDTITVTVEKQKHKIKITTLFSYNHETVKISDAGEDYYSTLDTLADIVKTKMERLHARKTSKRRVGVPETRIYVDKDEKEIVKRKFIVPGEMTEDEAIEIMNELGHPSFLFENADMNGAICLLYKRNVGNYGILETGR